MCIKAFKRRVGLVTYKQLRVISNIMLFKTIISVTKGLKNRAIFS